MNGENLWVERWSGNRLLVSLRIKVWIEEYIDD